MRATVLLNAAAGSIDSSETREEVSRVTAAFRSAGLEADVKAVLAEELPEAARAAALGGAEVVVVGGGDGTLSAAAGVLADGETPLGVLPLGTLNHFAKDLGIPLGLEEAVRTVAARNVRAIDVAEVNGRVFLNNSSIGLYPRAVERREERREGLGWGKWVAMLQSAIDVLRPFALLRVRLTAAGQAQVVTTPLVFVGNNRYEVSFPSPGTRSTLEGGELSLYVARSTGRFSLLRLVLLALLGRLEQARDFESLTAPEVLIETRRHRLRVSVDGEVARMQPPLRYRIRPRSLRVLAPPQGG